MYMLEHKSKRVHGALNLFVPEMQTSSTWSRQQRQRGAQPGWRMGWRKTWNAATGAAAGAAATAVGATGAAATADGVCAAVQGIWKLRRL